MTPLQFILARLKEPSTYAGLGILLSGLHLSQLQLDSVSQTLVALAGLASVFAPEK